MRSLKIVVQYVLSVFWLVAGLGRDTFAAEADTTAVMSNRPRPTASAPT